MNKFLFPFLMLFFATTQVLAQCEVNNGQILHANNIRTNFYAGGTSFIEEDPSSDWYRGGFYPAYLPNRENPIAINSGYLWIGAKVGASNEVRTAIADFRQFNGRTDYTPGPINPSTNRSLYPNDDCEAMNKVWKVYGYEIEAVQKDFEDNGQIDQVLPANIKGWPSRGNPFFESIWGFELPDIALAPFFDQNSNEQYEPHLGDYPIIGRDMLHVTPAELLWTVYNDDRSHDESRGEPLQVEVQMLAWAFQCQATDILNNTIFMRYRVKNYNPETLRDMRIGVHHYPGLGCRYDDFFGCDTLLNTTYYYNGDEEDGYEGSCWRTSVFPTDIPVQAFTILNHDMYAVSYSFIGDLCDPVGAIGYPCCDNQQYYFALDGLWRDGTERTMFGNGYLDSEIVTKFSFFDNPNDPDGWSQYSSGCASTSANSCHFPTTTSIAIDSLQTGNFMILDVAYSTHQEAGWSHIENVNLVEEEVPQIQAFYDDKFETLCAPIPSCETDCVWPGDTNQDGIVNGMDLFPIGIAMGKDVALQGAARPLINATWQPFSVEDWPSTFLNNTNYKHLDCDGNGILNEQDVVVVTRLWTKIVQNKNRMKR